MLTPLGIKVRSEKDPTVVSTRELSWDEEVEDSGASFSHYTGEMSGVLRHGNGKFVFANGCFYEGSWRSNLPCGLGIFGYPDGKYDAGVYSDGYLEGYGVANFGNGDVYEGYFRRGKMEGFGLCYDQGKREHTLGFYAKGEMDRMVECIRDKAVGEINFSICTQG